MEDILKIEGSEAVELASELASLTGTSPQEAALTALRKQAEHERVISARVTKTMAIAAELRRLMGSDVPGSNMSAYYDDEIGLPI